MSKTLTELTALTDTALDELAAGVMGWHLEDINKVSPDYGENWHYWVDGDGDTRYRKAKFRPTDSLNDAAELEAEIARRELRGIYTEAVQGLLRDMPPLQNPLFKLLNAPARLRTVAAVWVLSQEGNKE